MISFAEDSYFPFLKWKLGEVTALSELTDAQAQQVIPLFILPPAGEYDPEEERKLTPIEHIRSFGKRLAQNRGKRLTFVDAGCIDDDEHSHRLPVHPVTELLERARLLGATASPITALARSDSYQSAVARFVASHPELPICLRLTLNDLLGGSVEENVSDLLFKIGATPNKCVLAIDLGFYGGHDPNGLVQVLVEQLSVLRSRDEWRGLALAATSFPESLSDIKAGQSQRYVRYEWSLYSKLFLERSRLGRMPSFSDYAVEHPVFPKFAMGIQPTAHFRYSTDQHYLVVKGTSVRKPFGYEAIFPVAESLVGHPDFMGSAFSSGDKCICQIAQKHTKGLAWLWRKAAVNHHITLVEASLGQLFGKPAGVPAVQPEAFSQPKLF